MRAVAGGHSACTMLLLEHGADVNACSPDGDGPLHMACQEGHFALAQELVAHGARVDIFGFKESTPLMRAAAAGSLVRGPAGSKCLCELRSG